jgi:PAS domain S-box-containing protein
MERSAGQYRIFVVDDDRGLLRLIEKALVREGLDTATASSGADALVWLEANQPDLLLLDLKLQDMEGAELVTRLAALKRCPPFIIITGQGDERVAVEMMKRGARDYLVKDARFLQFVPAVVKRSLEQLDKERRLAEAEEQVHLVRSVIEQGFNAVLITGADLPDPRVLYINPSFARATGYRADQIVGQPLSRIAGLTNLQQRLRSGLPEGAHFLDELSTYQTAQGERWGEWRVGPVQDKSGKTTHWLIIFRDITERKRLEREILEISDQERRRIGQDLHDGLCQHLAGIELMSQVLEQKLAAKSKADAARVGDISRYVRDAIGQTRSLARGLSPVTLESEGLASALQELASNTEKMFGITCHVMAPQAGHVHAPAVETHLYRIAQEAVSNAIKHGKAREVRIQLEVTPERTLLSVTDDGTGIPEPPPRNGGMGLRIMDYRAGMIGGVLSIQRNSRVGTTVRCSVPISVVAPSGPSQHQ